jgi:membrane associated rhomboid family serine protease
VGQQEILAHLIVGTVFSAAAIADWQPRATLLHDILAITWGINVINWVLLGRAMNWLGIRPRTWIGLLGIAFSPLIHGNVKHLLGNTAGFLSLGWMLLLRGTTDFWIVTAITALFSGAGTWLLGRKGHTYPIGNQRILLAEAPHIGGSGVIFGYLGFLLVDSFFDRSLLALILSLVVGIFYWRLLPGIVPANNSHISWEGHLFGFTGGIVAARFLPEIQAWLS